MLYSARLGSVPICTSIKRARVVQRPLWTQESSYCQFIYLYSWLVNVQLAQLYKMQISNLINKESCLLLVSYDSMFWVWVFEMGFELLFDRYGQNYLNAINNSSDSKNKSKSEPENWKLKILEKNQSNQYKSEIHHTGRIVERVIPSERMNQATFFFPQWIKQF